MKYRLNFSYFSIIENLLKLMKKKYKQSNPFFFLFPGFVVKHFDFDRYLLSSKNGWTHIWESSRVLVTEKGLV